MTQQPSYPPAMLNAGAHMCRIDASFNQARAKHSTDPNSWDWSTFESVRKIKDKYPALDWLLILGYGTKWAMDPRFASASGGDNASPQRGVDLPATSPENLYGNYVFEAVRRYKDVVHCWESWNEPDLPNHAFFKGNGKDFFPYQRACYLAAKKADPKCAVIFAGLCFSNFEGYLHSRNLFAPTLDPAATSFFEDYLRECVKDPMAKANNYYFDAMNQHSYSRASDLYDYVAVNQALMKQYLGFLKPVWVTEMGFPDTGDTWGGNSDEYCDYILQTFAWASLSNTAKMFHFQLDNSNGHGLYSGMLGPPKPALTTYRDVLIKELSGAKLFAQLHGNAGVGFLKNHSPYQPAAWATGYDLFEFSRNGERILMAFTDTSKAVVVKIPARRDQAVLIDRHGVRSAITASQGSYEVRLPGATNLAGWPTTNMPKGRAMGVAEHLVGGATVIIVEK